MEYPISSIFPIKIVSTTNSISTPSTVSTPIRSLNSDYLRYENSYAKPPPELANQEVHPIISVPAIIRPRFSAPRRGLGRPPSNLLSAQERLWIQQRPALKRNFISPIKGRPIPASVDDSVNNVVQQSSIPQQSTPPPASRERNLSTSVELKQVRLEQRSAQLHHRLRRVQTSQSRQSVEKELRTAVASIHRALDTAANVRDAETLNEIRAMLQDAGLEQKLDNLLKSGQLRPELLNTDELRRSDARHFVQVLKRHENALRKIIALPTTSASNLSFRIPANVTLEADDRRYAERTTRSLESHLKWLKREYDDDATESSSGGESCDEDEKDWEDFAEKTVGKSRHSNIEQRASWHWWTERAWLGSRWSWTQFQLGDLEFKIRQNLDLHKQLRFRKGSQVFPIIGKKIASISKPLPQEIEEDASDDEDLNSALDGCARARPFELGAKRRIIGTQEMFRSNHKTLARSTVHCQCSPPVSPCVICGGRSDGKQMIDTQIQTRSLRNSIVDPTYHPRLRPYKRKDIKLDRKLQAYWCNPRWSGRSYFTFPHAKTVVSLLPSNMIRENRNNNSQEMLPSPNTAEPEKRRRGRPATVLYKRDRKLNTPASTSKLKSAKKGKQQLSRRNSMGATNYGSWDARLEPSSDAGKLGSRRATERPTFDINNIIVDSKVAAVTRVEKIPYKEIQTPEWRIWELHGMKASGSKSGSDIEDVSEEAFTRRHSCKEIDERQRFIPILFRDFHSASRRNQLQHQSSSVDSNGSVSGNASYATVLPNLANQQSITARRISDFEITSTELPYEPFSPRYFPLAEDELQEVWKENSFTHDDDNSGENIRSPSV